MDWEAFTPVSAAAGGVLIAIATGLVLFLNGKVAGISGVVARVLRPVAGDVAWRLAFLAGMVGGGATVFALAPVRAAFVPSAGYLGMGAAGFLVGLGTRIGGGCTSGHGVCGIGRLSTRSIAATCIFMGAGMATVYVSRHLLP